jgi:hypothetical protein
MKGIDLGSVRPPLPFLTVAQTQAALRLNNAYTKAAFLDLREELLFVLVFPRFVSHHTF